MLAEFWRRNRWLLLGIAVSLPVHLLLMVWLAAIVIERPDPGARAVRGVEVSLLPDGDLQRLLEDRLPEVRNPAIESAAGEIDPLELPQEIPASGGAASSLASGSLLAGLSDLPDGPGAGAGRGDPGMGTGSGGTSFFGLRARGTRFGYVIDKSGSMSFDGRWVRLAEELVRSLRELPESASFCVAFFDTSAKVFPPPAEGWTRARRSGIERFLRWARNVSPGGGTEPIFGFNHLLSLDVPPDAIFFMTDGEIPADQGSSILTRILRRARPIAVHCVLFEDRGPSLMTPDLKARADQELDLRVRQRSERGEMERLAAVALELQAERGRGDLAVAMRDRANERILRLLAQETGGSFRLVPWGGSP